MVRWFKETEADAGEYDVVKASLGMARSTLSLSSSWDLPVPTCVATWLNQTNVCLTLYAGTPPEDTVYTITSRFQVKEAVAECNPRTSPHCAGAGLSGISLVYMSCHCHAPACISCELCVRTTIAFPHSSTPRSTSYAEF